MANSKGVTVGVGVSDYCSTSFPCTFLGCFLVDFSKGIFDFASGNADSGGVARKEDGDLVALHGLVYGRNGWDSGRRRCHLHLV